MFEPNLIKPPKILEDVLSQDSENYTNHSKHRSTRPKHSSKENTICLNRNPLPQLPLSRDHDNQSVASNTSGRSKGKRTKQSTLARPKIISNFNDAKEDDNLSVHSNASKNSHKNNKKENTIMSKPKIQGFPKQKHNQLSGDQDECKLTSFKSAWKDEDESVINPYFVQQRAVKHMQDLNAFKEVQKKTSKGKFAPFAEIEQHHSNDEEPVIQLLQPAQYTNKQAMVGAKKSQQASKGAIENRMVFDESQVIFGQSKLRETKSRRRNIFEKSSIENISKVSHSIAESSVLGQSNRSRSKRREIFNSSREKQRKSQQETKTVIENESNMLSIGQMPLQSKDMRGSRKPSPKKVNAFVQLQKKVLNNENDDFGLDQSKSDLNLSASNHLGRDTNDRDSLILHLQPEKRKGVSIVGAKNYKESTQNMLQLHNNNLASIGISQSKTQSKEMVKVNNTLVSKELQDVKKLLSANEEYLNKLQHVALADSYQQDDKNYNTLHLHKNVEEHEKPWHQIVQDYEKVQPLNIKKVERSEKIVNKPDDKVRVGLEKEKIADLERKRLQQRQDQERRKNEELRQHQIQRQREVQEKMRQQTRLERNQRNREIELQRERQQQEKQEQRLSRQAELNRKRQWELQGKAKYQQQRKREQQLLTEKLREQKLQQEKQLQLQRQLEAEEREKKMKMKKLASLPSQISREEFSQNSEQSNKSSKKQKQKKESSLTRDKNHKVYIRAQSPRGEESFYQSQNEPSEQMQDKKQQAKQDKKYQSKQEKKPKLLSFEQQDFETKPKARTDINFYDNATSQKSLKPPSSKPPLSKRTNGSGGSLSKQKRPKQKTIAIQIKQKSLKPNKTSFKQKQPKKMSLMERAIMKHNEGSSNGSYSQDSYRNRDDMDSEQSRNSNSSKQSRGSLKKQSTLKINKNNMIHSKYANLPPRRQSSNSSSHEEQIQRIERQRMAEFEGRASQQRQQQKTIEANRMKEQILNDRVIVSKNCTYIDERGRLVTQDLVIKGRDVYGIPSSNKNIDQTVIQRMKRSRDERRSRSKSRDKNKLQKKKSRDSYQNEYNQNSSYGSSSFYANSSRASLQRNESASLYSNYGNYEDTNTLKQFIKPVQQVPNMYDQRSRKVPVKEQNQEPPRTLNDMFARKNGTAVTKTFNNNNSSTMQNSRSRKSLGRTERSFYKK